jgi:hypothetical protein
MGYLLKSAVKFLAKFSTKEAKMIKKGTDAIVNAALPKAVISNAKKATGIRGALVSRLIPKDPAKSLLIIAKPKPLSVNERLGSTIKKIQEKYPKGMPHSLSSKSSGAMKTTLFGGTALVATAGAFGVAKSRK